jgi:hypothetical protein
MHGGDQQIIPAESWPVVRAELADLLDTAESGGAAAARRWLESRRLEWVGAYAGGIGSISTNTALQTIRSEGWSSLPSACINLPLMYARAHGKSRDGTGPHN